MLTGSLGEPDSSQMEESGQKAVLQLAGAALNSCSLFTRALGHWPGQIGVGMSVEEAISGLPTQDHIWDSPTGGF